MNVREAGPADIPSLEVVRQQAVEAGLSGEYDRTEFADLVATPDDRLRDWVRDTDWRVLLCAGDLTPVAFGALETTTGRVGALYTAPAHEGRGCATALLERFEERGRAASLDRLHAAVPRNAVGFFEARGFERRGTVTGTIERVRVAKPLEQ